MLAENTVTGCLEWQGSRDRKGYGTLRRDGADHKAHRFAYEAVHGPIGSSEIFVLHKCDNPPCCNIDHLFLGDHADNMSDMKAKDRQAKGEKNSNAKLNAHMVVLIRKLYSEGVSQQKIADQFNISQTTVSYVNRRAYWKHVN